MSILPRDPSDVAGAQHEAPVMPAGWYEGEFEAVVREFASAAEGLGLGEPSEAELRRLCGQVAALTAELFSGEMAFEVRGDPEISGELHFTVGVAAKGVMDDVVARNNEWHRRLRRVLGRHAALFCLSIDVR